MIDPDLLAQARAHGSDAEYRAWIQRQPSCLSGKFSEWVDGEGRNLACHVRRAKNSGTAFKPEYHCVPLTYREHQVQHQYGEERLKPKSWWDEQAERYLRMWLASEPPTLTNINSQQITA